MEGSSTHLRCSVRIDLCALERNLGKLKYFMPASKGYMALVSADAFGYGMEAAVVRLMLSGADGFAATNAAEGAKVREVGSGWKVVVLSSSLPGEEDLYFEKELTPVLASLEETQRFENLAAALGKTISVHMRLPVFGAALPSREEAKEILQKLIASPRLRLEAFCLPGTGTGAPVEGTEADGEFLEYAAAKIGATSPRIYVHHSDVCNPSSIPSVFDKTIRAGLVLFGMKPSEKSILKDFKPEQALAFRTSVSQIKTLPKGATVGYARTYELVKESRIALLSVGYGDGIPRESSGKMDVIIRGKRAPVIGRVSMDQASVDVTDFDEIEVGDEAVIVGSAGSEEISIEEYCARLSITPAQALTSITKRVARFYHTLY